MLSDFFRINLPYGISKNAAGKWICFNREYMPIGFSKVDHTYDINREELSSQLPVGTKYKGLTENKLVKLSYSENGVHRNEAGEIIKIFFYNDATNPMNDAKRWPDYMERIKAISSCEVANVLQ